MVVLGGIGHIPGVILGALMLSALPEVLRYVAGPLQQMTDGRLDASILRQLLVALAMIGLLSLPVMGAVAPVGGVLMIAGWIALALTRKRFRGRVTHDEF